MLASWHIPTRLAKGVSLAALTLAIAGHAARASDFPASIDASQLDGTIGFFLVGESLQENAGRKAAPVGDVNGDGFDDLIISAPDADPQGRADTGSAYVVFGKAGSFGTSLNLAALTGSNGFRLDGAITGETFGNGVAAGDINGDGLSDIVISNDNIGTAGGQGGTVYVVFGKRAPFASRINVSTLNGVNGFRLTGSQSNQRFGGSVAAGRDINNDGVNDLMIGAHGTTPAGAAFVVFGKRSVFPSILNVSTLSGSNGFKIVGVTASDALGRDVDLGADVNGDGIDDLVIGAPYADPNGNSSGQAFVLFGKATPFAATVSAANLGGINGFRIDGGQAGAEAGYSVKAAGDVNGDGLGDILIGEPGHDSGVNGSGGGYVVFGRSTPFVAPLQLSALAPADGIRLQGFETNGYAGTDVSAADVNGDGFDDAILGSPGATVPVNNAGAVFVAFGNAAGTPSSLNLSTLNGVNGFRINGIAVYDSGGQAAQPAGDLNGDGFDDIVMGAPYSDLAGNDTGAAFVVFGRGSSEAVSRIGSAASQYISGGGLADLIESADGDDVLEGRDGGDTLDGDVGEDTASYLHAPAGVAASLVSNAANTGHALGDVYQDIEHLEGSRFGDTLTGDGDANRLTGNNGDDALLGGDDNDILVGGRGQDTLTGGPDSDQFVYSFTGESPRGTGRDVIADFNAGSATSAVDVINLAAVDANTKKYGDQKFRFIGKAAFSKTKGELRAKLTSTGIILQGDTTGDGKADMEIKLQGFISLKRLKANDFSL